MIKLKSTIVTDIMIIIVFVTIFTIWLISKTSIGKEPEYIDGMNSFKFQFLATAKNNFVIYPSHCCLEQCLEKGDTVEWLMQYPDTVSIYAIGKHERLMSISQEIPAEEFFTNFENFKKID